MTLKCAKCLVALCAAGEPSGVSIADLGRGSCHIRLSIPPRRDVSCDFSEWTDRPTLRSRTAKLIDQRTATDYRASVTCVVRGRAIRATCRASQRVSQPYP